MQTVEALKRDKLLNACINGEGDIFHELKKLRMVSCTVSKTMDGAQEDVSEHFANVYERIYNDKEEMSRMYSRVNKSIDTTSLSDVYLVTNDIVREATMNLKSNRNDPIFDFNFNCLKYAPLIVFEHLTCLIKSFLVHAHVSNIILLATLIPIPKDKLVT